MSSEPNNNVKLLLINEGLSVEVICQDVVPLLSDARVCAEARRCLICFNITTKTHLFCKYYLYMLYTNTNDYRESPELCKILVSEITGFSACLVPIQYLSC